MIKSCGLRVWRQGRGRGELEILRVEETAAGETRADRVCSLVQRVIESSRERHLCYLQPCADRACSLVQRVIERGISLTFM